MRRAPSARSSATAVATLRVGQEGVLGSANRPQRRAPNPWPMPTSPSRPDPGASRRWAGVTGQPWRGVPRRQQPHRRCGSPMPPKVTCATAPQVGNPPSHGVPPSSMSRSANDAMKSSPLNTGGPSRARTASRSAKPTSPSFPGAAQTNRPGGSGWRCFTDRDGSPRGKKESARMTDRQILQRPSGDQLKPADDERFVVVGEVAHQVYVRPSPIRDRTSRAEDLDPEP